MKEFTQMSVHTNVNIAKKLSLNALIKADMKEFIEMNGHTNVNFVTRHLPRGETKQYMRAYIQRKSPSIVHTNGVHTNQAMLLSGKTALLSLAL